MASVVGMDPGGPLFSLDVPADRIDAGDANFVEIHITDGGRLGFEHPVGHANYYPNWGLLNLIIECTVVIVKISKN